MCRSNLCDGEFWLERPSCLFANFQIIPTRHMTLEDRLNCITRLVILVSILLFVFGRGREATYFLLISLIAIVAMYYIVDSNNGRHEVRAPLGSAEQAETPPHIRKHETEINQRRPHPPTVPEDFVVKNPRPRQRKPSVLAPRPEPVPVTQPQQERIPVQATKRGERKSAFDYQIEKMQNIADIRGTAIRVTRQDALHQIFGT